MSIQKEVEKYQKAKADLNGKFLAKMADLRSKYLVRNNLIDQTVQDLKEEKSSNELQIKDIENATSEVK